MNTLTALGNKKFAQTPIYTEEIRTGLINRFGRALQIAATC